MGIIVAVTGLHLYDSLKYKKAPVREHRCLNCFNRIFPTKTTNDLNLCMSRVADQRSGISTSTGKKVVSMISKITTAIEKGYVLSIFYDGGYREIEPHALGYTRAGNLALRGYQRNGYSRSGKCPDWKLLRINRAGDLSSDPDTSFTTRPEYKMNDRHLPQIIAQRIKK